MTKAKALVKFDFDVAVISALDERYKDIQTAEGTKNLALVMKGLSEYCEIRLAIDGQYKKLNADILEAGRGLRGDRDRLKTLIQPGENRLRDLKNTEDDRKDAIREEKEAKERERIEEIQLQIGSIRDLGMGGHNVVSSAIKDRLTLVTGIMISEDVYQEFTDQAIEVHKAVVATLEEALTNRLRFEKEEEDRKAEAKRLEAQRKEQEAAQAKIDEENRKINDEKAMIAAEKGAEALRKDREEWEKDEKARILLELEERKAEKEEAERKKKAEEEILRPDREKLIKFADELTDIKVPVGKSNKAQQILIDARHSLDKLATDIKEKAQKL